MNENYDVIVSGAGPAGTTAALFLARSGKKVLLLDKEKFPRDKICADNKTWLCIDIVKELGLWTEFEKLEKQPIKGLVIASPAGHEFYTPLLDSDIAEKGTWYNVRRYDFDNMLTQACKKEKNIDFVENAEVFAPVKVDWGERVTGVAYRKYKNGGPIFSVESASAKVVVGADGSQSQIACDVGLNPWVKGRYAVNARAYFENVSGPMDRCELYYLKGVCPGYFWIFPVDSKTCNVGVGMRYEDIQKQGIDLEKKLSELISSKKFAARFAKAEQVTSVGTWGLSVLDAKRKWSGNGFILCGDAGTFAMTFSGEGVGPSMRSGKIAAQEISNAFLRNDFSAQSLESYDKAMWKILEPEVRGFKFLETLILNEWLFDFVVKIAGKKSELVKISSRMQCDYAVSQEFLKPSTILKLFF